MKSNWRNVAARGWCVGMLAIVALDVGCVVHARGGFDQVDIIGVDGFHHQGYYDDHHVWHGGYYDDHHQFHGDAPDWHR